MERNHRVATWMGTLLGIFLALLLNVALAHAREIDDTVVSEEFHQTYPLTANGRVELENINGAVHISVWDRNEVKVDAVKRAQNEDQLKDAEIIVENRADSISIETKYREREKGYRYFDGRNNPASVEYTLTVPRNARLDEIKLICRIHAYRPTQCSTRRNQTDKWEFGRHRSDRRSACVLY